MLHKRGDGGSPGLKDEVEGEAPVSGGDGVSPTLLELAAILVESAEAEDPKKCSEEDGGGSGGEVSLLPPPAGLASAFMKT